MIRLKSFVVENYYNPKSTIEQFKVVANYKVYPNNASITCFAITYNGYSINHTPTEREVFEEIRQVVNNTDGYFKSISREVDRFVCESKTAEIEAVYVSGRISIHFQQMGIKPPVSETDIQKTIKSILKEYTND